MYRKCNFIRKVMHYVLILSLLLTTIVPGFSPMEVLAEDETTSTGTESVFYVDGTGSGEQNGNSKENAFKTVEEAYKVIPENATKTTIVICGNVKPYEGAIQLADNQYRFTKPAGEVIITSVYEQADYTDTAAINFEYKNYYFLGDTTFENINISGKAKYIYANYFPLHLGKGITVSDWFAERIYMGTGSTINGSTGNKTPISIADTSFTMESGKTDVVYGGGDSYQGGTAKGKDNKVAITIDGGTVNILYGSGAGGTDNAHHKSVEITVNNGTVNNLYGAHATATIYDDVSINIKDGKVTNLYGARKYNKQNGDNANYTPHIKGDVIVTLTGGTITNLNAKEDGAIVNGNLVFQYPNNAQGVTLPTAKGFDTLKLSDASTLQAAINAADATIKSDSNATVEIDLLGDVESSDNITIGSGVTLDLNGKTLDMGGNYLLSSGNVVDNSEDKTGRLKIATYAEGEREGVEAGEPKALLAENNAHMPVYIAGEGYMLASMKAQATQTKAEDLSSFNSISRPSFGSAHVDKLQRGASAAKLQFILRLDWTKGGTSDYQEFYYSDSLVQNVYTEGKAFSVTVNGLTDYASSMKISEYVKSDLGVVLENNSFSMVEAASE